MNNYAVAMIKANDDFYLLSDNNWDLIGRDSVKAMYDHISLQLTTFTSNPIHVVMRNTATTLFQIMTQPRIVMVTEEQLELNDLLFSSQWTKLVDISLGTWKLKWILLNWDPQKVQQLFDSWICVGRKSEEEMR